MKDIWGKYFRETVIKATDVSLEYGPPPLHINSYIMQDYRRERLVKEIDKMTKGQWIKIKNILHTQTLQFICMHKWIKWIKVKRLLWLRRYDSSVLSKSDIYFTSIHQIWLTENRKSYQYNGTVLSYSKSYSGNREHDLWMYKTLPVLWQWTRTVP